MARVGRIVVPGMPHHVPIGDDGFLASIGRLLGRDLTPPKHGRRPKGPTSGEREAAGAEY